jgi:hypothetical protein
MLGKDVDEALTEHLVGIEEVRTVITLTTIPVT